MDFLLPLLPLPLAAFLLLWHFFDGRKKRLTLEEPVPVMADPGIRQLEYPPSVNEQIEKIGLEVPDLLETLPYDTWFEKSLKQEHGEWRFTLKCNSVLKHFFVTGLAKTPMEAFLIAKHTLHGQVRDWHDTRFEGEMEQVSPRAIAAAAPRFLIVDDDIDLAMAMQTALAKLGCKTEVATKHEDLHRKIVNGDADYILLDWKLNNEVNAGQVMEKATRLINTFSDLREKFIGHRPRVVTYSVLARDEIRLPAAGLDYFDHLDHWQKPMPFTEVIRRASNLLEIDTAGGGAA